MQLILPIIPGGSTHIYDLLSVCNVNGDWIYYHGMLPLFSHNEEDINTFRMFSAQLICQGACRNIDIINAFGVSPRSVIRSVKKYRLHGTKAFFAKRNGRGGSVITEEVKKRILLLFSQGKTRQEVANELDIKADTLRKAINDGRIQVQQNNESATDDLATDKSTRNQRDASGEMGVACTRTGERLLTAVGVMSSASTRFEPCRDVTFGGVLCALPALASNGLFKHIDKCFKKLEGYYTTIHILILLAYMALCRIKTAEQLRYHPPGELGKLMGLDRIPEVRCLRKKLKELSTDNDPDLWANILSKDWMEKKPDLAGTLYIDGHVSVYHGSKTKLPRRYVSRQRLCLRGITNYWVNDILGQPFFVVERQVDKGMLEALRTDIVPRLLKDIPNQPTKQELEADPELHRFTLVFDREGYSPAFFKEMWEEHKIACITYHKYPKETWPEKLFKPYNVTMPNSEQITMKLANKDSVIGSGEDKFKVHEIRKLTDSGHQTSLISSAYKLSLTENAVRIFSRWSQENFFGYMMHHFAIDLLSERGTEEFPGTCEVVNPQWRELDRKRRTVQAKLNRQHREFGKLCLDNRASPKDMVEWKKRKTDLCEEIMNYEHDIAEIKVSLKETAKHIQWEELPNHEKFKRLLPDRRHFLDTVRMIAYRAETSMVTIVREVLKRNDDARALIRDLFASEADILPDNKNNILNICVHYKNEARQNQAIGHLLQHLNNTEYKYPGTKYTLNFSLGNSKSNSELQESNQ